MSQSFSLFHSAYADEANAHINNFILYKKKQQQMCRSIDAI